MKDHVPIPDIETWSRQLSEIATQPLENCEDFPIIAQRYEAWWAHDVLDRPLFIASADKNPARPLRRRLEWLDQPDAWLEAKLADMAQLHRVGDKLPTLRVDFGPVALGGLFGGRVEFKEDTTWTHACINDDWSNEPAWIIAEDNPWWKMMLARLDQAALHAPGRYVITVPALGGSADVLLNLRGASQLCIDVIDKPGKITAALDKIYAAWRHAFSASYRHTVERGAGVMRWANLWSNRPYFVTECDFNYMISPRQFERLFLPDIARIARTAGRSLFHLDGPNATRHIDTLLAVPEIQAIQYVPGAGAPSALKWVELFRKIQRAGKSLQILCLPEEVLPLCDELKPAGLAFWLELILPPNELDQLYEQFCHRFAKN